MLDLSFWRQKSGPLEPWGPILEPKGRKGNMHPARECYALALAPTPPLKLSLGYPSTVQLVSHVRLFATPWNAARQASLSIINSRSPPKPMSTESVMPSNQLTLCCPLLLYPKSSWKPFPKTLPKNPFMIMLPGRVAQKSHLLPIPILQVAPLATPRGIEAKPNTTLFALPPPPTT